MGHQFAWKSSRLKGQHCFTSVPNLTQYLKPFMIYSGLKIRKSTTYTHISGRQLKIIFIAVSDHSEYLDFFSRKHSFLSEEAKWKIKNLVNWKIRMTIERVPFFCKEQKKIFWSVENILWKRKNERLSVKVLKSTTCT